MEDIFTDDTMSEQEYIYLTAINEAATAYCTSIREVYRLLRGVFIHHGKDPKVQEYNKIVVDSIGIAKRLSVWATSNMELNHFPSTLSEIRDAKKLADEGGDGALRLQYEYKQFTRFTEYFDNLTDLPEHLQKTDKNNDRLYTIIRNIEDAISVDDTGVHARLLPPLPR